MKRDYRFWEHNLNPITMQPNDNKNHSSTWDLDEMGKSQKKREAIEERQLIRADKELRDGRIKRVGKFW